MKKLFCYAAFALLMSGLSQISAAAGNADRGAKLVSSCTACHGQDGNSPSPAFPKLAGLGEKYLTKQLRDIQAGYRKEPGGRLVSQMMGQLNYSSDQDLQDMAAYYSGQKLQLSGAKKTKVQINSGAKVDSLVLGEKIYRAGNFETHVPACSGCHSPRGLGNEPAANPRLGGQHADYIVKQLKDFRAGNRVNDGEAMVMRGVAKNMSDAEIEAVANFIAGLN